MSTLDQFEVLETLGTGSFGTVAKLRRKSDGKAFVWKEINFGTMSEKEKTQLVAEVNILRELRSPFIVKYHDRIVDKPRTRLYIIMEHCAGGDLSGVIKRHKQARTSVDEAFIWKILAQSVLALKDCHRRVESGDLRPVLHRDLKPANILLDAEQNVKMADFGLAKELSSSTKFAQTNVGTPYYMAPEIIKDLKYDEKSDIWSLGCLLYELAAQRPPFEANNAVNLAVKINAGRFSRIPSRYSDQLFDVLRQMIQLDPRRRPRVEDLEVMPAVAPHIAAAKATWHDFKLQQTYAQRAKELKAKEDELKLREEALRVREEAVKAREEAVASEERERDYRRRISLGRVTEEMDEDCDAAAPASSEPSAPAVSEQLRRGPVPVPSSSALTAGGFRILVDDVAPPAPPRLTSAVSSTISSASTVLGSNNSAAVPVSSKQMLMIPRVDVNNKENLAPNVNANIPRPSSAAGVGKPFGRPLPSDCQPEAEDVSPLKRMRGAYRYTSTLAPPPPQVDVDAAQQMYARPVSAAAPTVRRLYR